MQRLHILQRGTINSTAPLQRFNVPDEELNGYWDELHKTSKVQNAGA
ncbi:hypothetical protein [Burkholderia ubonensis]|nr:hypothetical protein [Burkholderia ubonensis]